MKDNGEKHKKLCELTRDIYNNELNKIGYT